jgi:hypothetical protein
VGCKLSKKCSKLKWSVVQWRGMKSGCTVKGIYGCWSEVKWGEVKWSEGLVKMVCYTCGLKTLETRYCSFSTLCCFFYMYFVLICTVVVLYCFVSVCVCVCVCVRVCMCGFCNVCVSESFVICGCFGNMYTVFWLSFLRFFRAFSSVVRQMR